MTGRSRAAVWAATLAATLMVGGACAGDDGSAAGCDRLVRSEVTIPRDEYLARAAAAPPPTTSTSTAGGGATIGVGTTGAEGSGDAEDELPPIRFDGCVAICESAAVEVEAPPWSCAVARSDAATVTVACLWTLPVCASP